MVIEGTTGNDILPGTGDSDTINGGAGHDHIEGLGGNDFLYGQEGIDTVWGGDGDDLVNGGDDDDNLTGDNGNDNLLGGAGHDSLNGGAGSDRMTGGAGDDTYYVDSAGDVVIEGASGGFDHVRSLISYALTDNVEALELSGTGAINGTGNALDNFLYGNSAANRLSGDLGNDTLDGGGGSDILEGGWGNDTYYVDDASAFIVEDVSAGSDGVIAQVSYTLAANVEYLYLALNDLPIGGTGNAGDNTLVGNDAANVLDGGDGQDALIGALGSDTLRGGGGFDTAVYLYAGSGVVADLVAGSVSGGDGNDQLESIENLTGSAFCDELRGDAGTNRLYGEEGDDVLDGRGGDDLMEGGAGDDTFYVDSFSDYVFGGEGADRIIASASYQLSNGMIEAVELTGSENLLIWGDLTSTTLIGNAGDNQIWGDGGSDIIYGHAGDDTLNGVEYAVFEADQLHGGIGNDTYQIDSTVDAVIELAGEGTDTVYYYGDQSYTLGAFVEDLVLWGIEGGGIGNSLANMMEGNGWANIVQGMAGDDRLFGMGGDDTLDGGRGRDVLFGGFGNDTFVVDHLSDAPIEGLNEGTDLVQASVAYTLKANVENLTQIGIFSIHGRGNELANVMTGNVGSNRLWGEAGNDTLIGNAGSDQLDGGTGDDTLVGGVGNDIYFVDSVGDTTTENLGEGQDTVRTTIAWTLDANIERIELMGTGNISGTANDLNNIMWGNAGNNTLEGAAGIDRIYARAGNDTVNGGAGGDWLEGGTGQDSFIGGLGSDRYVFREGDFGGNTIATADRIIDFGDAEGDRIRLDLIDADTTVDGNQKFAWLGDGAFTGVAGQLRYEQIAGNTYVSGDTNGDGIADFMIRVDGLHSLGTDDFLF